ncbi:MEDS domain-containing protein [Nocardia sp. NPDC058058]|uniref:MEDS domain-containing protein n=1 Tax=Nocardia sp. NPDC058058 TaxID=3346317 RepID=UPI0036DAD085
MEVATACHTPNGHIAIVYDADHDLVEKVGAVLATGLAADAAVLVIATESHRNALVRRLGEYDIDLRTATATGRFRCLDAAETLSRLMVDGALDRNRFAEVIGGAITQAGEGARPVRIFGEMVDLLWAAGDVNGAFELEALWNEISGDHTLSLCCAYPRTMLARTGDLALAQQVCVHHSSVIAPGGYLSGTASANLSEHHLDTIYPPVPEAVPAARRLVTDQLQAWGHPAQFVDDAALVVSELVANAVIHAGTMFRVSITRSDTSVTITTEDLSSNQPALNPHRARTSTGGRGLLLIAAISSRWGIDPVPHGKRVWSEIACTPVQQ